MVSKQHGRNVMLLAAELTTHLTVTDISAALNQNFKKI